MLHAAALASLKIALTPALRGEGRHQIARAVLLAETPADWRAVARMDRWGGVAPIADLVAEGDLAGAADVLARTDEYAAARVRRILVTSSAQVSA
ncbi:MAG: hypothetical protein ACEQSX_10740 [Baekduiaceae bacterium]